MTIPGFLSSSRKISCLIILLTLLLLLSGGAGVPSLQSSLDLRGRLPADSQKALLFHVPGKEDSLLNVLDVLEFYDVWGIPSEILKELTLISSLGMVIDDGFSLFVSLGYWFREESFYQRYEPSPAALGMPSPWELLFSEGKRAEFCLLFSPGENLFLREPGGLT